ncbi:unnamed protein product, partial [Prunus brigantina]
AANAANVSTHLAQTSNWGQQSQSFHAPPQFSNSQSSQLNPSNGPSAKELQQPAHAMSIMNANRVFGNNNSFANALGLSSSTNVSINSAFTKPWILDSGATDHITSDSTLFTKTESCPMRIVNLPIGSTVPITSTGTVPFNSDITLDKVLCVPSFRLNLMSASKVTNSLNCCVLLFLMYK